MPYVEPLSQYVACAIVPWCVLKSAPANVTYRMPRGPGATAAAATPRRAPTIPAAAEAMAKPARPRDDHREMERGRPDPDVERPVRPVKRDDHVERVHLRGLVQQQRGEVPRPEGDPEPGRPVVERPQRTVLREPVEHRGAQRDPRQDRDAEGGVRRHPGGARDEPDEELRIHSREAIAGAGGGGPQPQETCA